jgi:hypothetical protein
MPETAIHTHPNESYLYDHHIWTAEQLSKRAKELKFGDYLIDGLVPQQAINIVVGDSGLGKSPLLYQAGMCVAAGGRFLGREVRQERVLYIDHENGVAQIDGLVVRLTKFLGLAERPTDFRIWSANDSTEPLDLAAACEQFKPSWVIIDPLSLMWPSAERDNPSAAEVFKFLRQLMSRHHCAVTIMHHLRKPSDNPKAKREPLETAEWNTWFHQARGPSVFINNSDVRLGVDRPAPCLNKDHLILKGFERVNGEIPIIRLCRVRNQGGEPVGYRLVAGADLLDNPEQRAAYEALPPEFSFGEAKVVYRREDQPTADFLKKCDRAGILRKVDKGRYQKINPAAEHETIQ